MSNDFCCDELRAILKNPSCPLKYYAYLREYVLTAPDYLRSKKKNVIYPSFIITHCPRCGTEFLQDLSDQWYDIMEKEFGLKGLIGPDEAKLIPEEYKTDEWWKKRGL